MRFETAVWNRPAEPGARPPGALHRIGKTASAVAGGVTAYALSQALSPPVFITSYGVRTYGEWLTLSASASWIVNLDLGMQAYVVNQVSIEYFRGNLVRVKELQSAALWVSSAVVAAGLAFACIFLWAFPLNSLLHLEMTQWGASLIGLALVFQMLVHILWGQLNGMLQAVGYPERAHTWQMLRIWLYVALTLGLALAGLPLWIVAAGQLVPYFVLGLVSLLDLHRHAPEVVPGFLPFDRQVVTQLLKPSLLFLTFSLGQFLIFQVPILALNELGGKMIVVSFSMCRTYFGLLKHGLMPVRWAMRPEFTRCAADRDWEKLKRAYGLYERVCLAAALALVPASLAVAPFLVRVWTGRADFFEPGLYTALALAAVGYTLKDSRLELQYSINQHERAAVVCLSTYGLFAVAVAPAAMYWGGMGVCVLWAVTEFLQARLLARENRMIMPHELESSARIGTATAISLCIVLGWLGSTSFKLPPTQLWHWGFIPMIVLTSCVAYRGSGISAHSNDLLFIVRRLFRLV